MEDALRAIQTEVTNKLESSVVSRRPQLEKLQFEVSDLLKKFENADYDRSKLYFRVAVVLILVEQAGLIK